MNLVKKTPLQAVKLSGTVKTLGGFEKDSLKVFALTKKLGRPRGVVGLDSAPGPTFA